MRIGVDLLWVKPGKCGGTESYIRNLLDGFVKYDSVNEYVLFVAEDNKYSFEQYRNHSNMRLCECKVKCLAPLKRYMWENCHLDRTAQKEKIEVMFIPVYSKPVTYGSGIPYVCSIADLQAMHYPQYFSKFMYWFMRFIWWYACKSSNKIIAISDDCKKDIQIHYPFAKDKVKTLYLPVVSEKSEMKCEIIEQKYKIKRNEYFYCVSSMLPHKNLVTILKVIAKLKKSEYRPQLVISGVGGEKKEFDELCKELEIEDCVIQTGFVENRERDCLYENCKLFLFPSIFEGFGMPPIEAMRKGKHVITTKKSCLYEITEGKAIYVENPFDVNEWIEKIGMAEKIPEQVYDFAKYNLENITKKYIEILVAEGKRNER